MSTNDPELTITLPRSKWVTLIGPLGQLPYAEVADIIEEIVRQAGAQLEAPERQAADETVRAN